MRIMAYTATWQTQTPMAHPNVDGLALADACHRSVTEQAFSGKLFWRIDTENPYQLGDHRNVLAHYQRARTLTLDSGYDALLTVEHDMILEPGTVQALADTDADVVYAPYLLRYFRFLSAWSYIGDEELGPSLTQRPDELAAARAAGTWRVSGIGHGCTLIRRHVLERLEFHSLPKIGHCPDLPFAIDCLRAGFLSLARMDFPAVHLQDGRPLHAYDFVGAYEYLALATATATVRGQPYELYAGNKFFLLPSEAEPLLAAGMLAPLEVADGVA